MKQTSSNTDFYSRIAVVSSGIIVSSSLQKAPSPLDNRLFWIRGSFLVVSCAPNRAEHKKYMFLFGQLICHRLFFLVHLDIYLSIIDMDFRRFSCSYFCTHFFVVRVLYVRTQYAYDYSSNGALDLSTCSHVVRIKSSYVLDEVGGASCRYTSSLPAKGEREDRYVNSIRARQRSLFAPLSCFGVEASPRGNGLSRCSQRPAGSEALLAGMQKIKELC